MTLKSKDPVKVVSVRATSFPPLTEEGGSGKIEQAPSGSYNAPASEFISQELAKSDRPDLASAKVVVSGGKLVICSCNGNILSEKMPPCLTNFIFQDEE